MSDNEQDNHLKEAKRRIQAILEEFDLMAHVSIAGPSGGKQIVCIDRDWTAIDEMSEGGLVLNGPKLQNDGDAGEKLVDTLCALVFLKNSTRDFSTKMHSLITALVETKTISQDTLDKLELVVGKP